MAVTADSVVLSLEAKVDGYTGPLQQASTAVTSFRSKAEESANSVERSITNSSQGSGQALLILQGVARRTSDQFAAGAAPATILAEHIAGIAEAAEFAGGPVKLLEIAISGGLGLAISVVLPLLIELGSRLLGSGEKAAQADKGLQAFQQRQADLARFIDAANGRLREQNRLLAEVAGSSRGAEARQANSDANAYVNQAFAEARAGAASAQGAGSRSGPTGDALAANRAILDAGSNVQELRRNLEAAAETNPGLRKLAETVNELAGRAAEAAQDSSRYKAEQQDLNTVQHNGVVVTTDLIQRQVAHRVAVDGVARAQANLADVQARKADIDKLDAGPEKTRQTLAYGTALETAERAVKSAQDAQEAHNKALSEAKAAAARAKTEAYALAEANARLATATNETQRAEAELAIVRARKQSLSPAEYQSAVTQAEANVELAKTYDALSTALEGTSRLLSQVNEAQQKPISEGFKEEDKDVHKEVDNFGKGLSDTTDAAVHEALQRQQEGVRTLAGLYQDLFSGGTKSLWQDFTRLGEEALAKLAAKKTFELIGNLISGGASGGGGLLSSLFGSVSGHDTGGAFQVGSVPGHDTGGSFQVGGAAGIDNNLLSINGKPVSRVSSSETVAIIPQARLQASAQQGATQRGANTTVIVNQTLDARYGVTTTELLQRTQEQAVQAAVFGMQAGGQAGYAEVLRRSQRPNLPGALG